MRRLFSFLLVLCLMFSMVPASLASGADDPEQVVDAVDDAAADEAAKAAKEAEEAAKAAKEAEEAAKAAKEAEEAEKAAEEARKAKEAEEARKAKEAEEARKAKEAEEAKAAKEAEEAKAAKEAEEAAKAAKEEEANKEEEEKPAATAGGEGQKPDEEGQKPDEEGQKPDEEGQKPDEEGQKPDEEGQKPDEEGQKPDEEGQKPDEEGLKDEQSDAPEANSLKNSPEDPEEEPELPGGEVIAKTETPPEKVKNLKVTNPEPKKITLTWSAVTSPKNANGYEVRYSTENNFDGAEDSAKTTASTSYTVSGLTCGVTYYYWVRAYYEDGGAVTAWSDKTQISYRTSPDAPNSFQFALTSNSATTLKFDWTQVPGVSGYYIYRVENGTEVQAYKMTQNPATPTATIYNITPADTLTYRIYSYLVVNKAEVKSADYTEYVWDYEIPKVNDLQGVSVGKSSIRLTWKAMTGAQKYYVRLYDNASDYPIVATVTNTTYTGTDLTFGQTYSYYVSAVYENWEGERAYVTVQVSGAAPENVKVVNNPDDNTNKVSWDKVETAEGYELEVSTDFDATNPSAASWAPAVAGNYLSWTQSGLTLGTQYSYRVRAYVQVGTGKVYTPWSLIVSAVAAPAQPKNVKVVNTNYKTQDMTWDAVTGAAGYEVSVSTESTFAKATKYSKTGTSHTHNDCTNGTKYYYRVRAYITSGTTKVFGPYSEVVSLTCAPGKPTVTAAYTPGVNKVKLSWAQVSGATHYRIYYKENDGSWVTVTEVTASTSTQTYTISDLTVGSTYVFGVAAVRISGGATGVGQRGTTVAIELDVIDYIPTQLKYTVVSATSVKLTWKAVNGISNYLVNGSCAELPEYSLSQIVTTNSITVTGLKAGYAYDFTVQSRVKVDGTYKYSNKANIQAIPTSLAPKDLKAEAKTNKYAVKLSWSKAAGANGYIIEWAGSADATTWTTVWTNNDPDTLTYTDLLTKAEAGKTRFYRIKSYVEHGGNQESDPSAAVKVVVKVPKAVIEVKSLDKTQVSIDVTNDSVITADKYIIYRSTSKDSGYKVIASSVTSLPYVDTSVKFGTVYYYKVRGVVKNGSVEVNGVLSDPVKGQGKLKAVTGVAVSVIHGGSIKVKWNALSGATGYNVYYKVDGGSWKLYASVGKTTLKKLVKGLNPKTKYYFRVAGTAKVGDKVIVGSYSSSVLGMTKMEQVKNVKTKAVTYNSMKVSWDAVKDTTKYQVYVQDPKDSTGAWVLKATTDKTSVTITGLGRNKEYNVRVRAYISRNSVKDYGAYSAEVKGHSAPAKVTGLEVSDIKKTAATVTWKAVKGADGYKVRYAVSGTSTWTEVILAGTTSYRITGLAKNTKYKVQVQAYGNEDSIKRWGPYCTKVFFTTKK